MFESHHIIFPEVEKYSRSRKKRNTPINFNTNYHIEMKLVPIITDYCLLQFDALKNYLGGASTWGVLT